MGIDQWIGGWAEIKGAYVRLCRDGGPTDEPERPPLGSAPPIAHFKASFQRRDLVQNALGCTPWLVRGVGTFVVAEVVDSNIKT